MRRPERQGHLGLGVGREQNVERAIGSEQDDCVMMWILALDARPVRPEDTEPEPAEPVDEPDPRRDDPDVLLPRLCERRPLVGAVRGLERVEDKPDLEAIEDLGGATHVVAMRMGDDDDRQPGDAERPQLVSDLGLGRALVHEHRTLRHLQQDGVALPDVENGHTKATRR